MPVARDGISTRSHRRAIDRDRSHMIPPMGPGMLANEGP
ncbi:MAG: hypothetical protein AVDCRST_MAG88-2218 [uncultured Thermomicrobiales bacterium]|uniref:Uncharacterized protein n=1 Tax=uncultured Thermomicrobiales bacterium TaxID=1645740 RepID=A0A6J4VA74_9BACT|nr:MAG: hypothetical protein AVDCRST_MAG88-2218 [uncultured Thermomicrobiales bacterium]